MFERNITNLAKIICILCVVLQHYEQYMKISYLDPLKYIGLFGVLGFFFLSGYGLSMSYKKDGNVDSFINKRLTNIIWPCV